MLFYSTFVIVHRPVKNIFFFVIFFSCGFLFYILLLLYDTFGGYFVGKEKKAGGSRENPNGRTTTKATGIDFINFILEEFFFFFSM